MDTDNQNQTNDIRWLCLWVASQYDGTWQHDGAVVIDMYDNPGWAFRVALKGTDQEGRLFDRVFEEDDDSVIWIVCCAENNVFTGDGDLSQLPRILSLFRAWVEGGGTSLRPVSPPQSHLPSTSVPPQPGSVMDSTSNNHGDDLRWLRLWIASQCDGEWEHGYAFKSKLIEVLGWSFVVHLEGTDQEGRQFDRVEEGHSNEGAWILCRVENNIFEGLGDVSQLPRILSLFRAWVEGSATSS